MNSLVAYDSSSDDNSGSESESNHNETQINNITSQNDHILLTKKSMTLPAPKDVKYNESSSLSDEDDNMSDLNIALILPQPSNLKIDNKIKEEDDEFLKKKAIPAENPPPKINQPVKIRLPSMASFKDDDNDSKNVKVRIRNTGSSGGGLLSLLPKPKSETLFTQSKPKPGEPQKVNPFIPHSVANRNKFITKNKTERTVNTLVNSYESDDSENEESKDDESEDFFSLNKEDKLPEVSINEIHAMVAKKAAKIASTATKFSAVSEQETNNEPTVSSWSQHNEFLNPQPQLRNTTLEDDDLKQLIGNKVKRKKTEDINIVEISHEEVMPNRNDWMRNALASSTQFVSKGIVSDDNLVPGSKRKHQITYLAHQAKANEAELQAMWAANRQSRRQTQSKYGF